MLRCRNQDASRNKNELRQTIGRTTIRSVKPCCEVGFATRIDGANALLFHMEHCDNRSWRYRVCYPGSETASLREWSWEQVVGEGYVFVGLADPNVSPKFQWRRDDNDAPWHEATSYEFSQATETFVVRVSKTRDMTADPVLQCASLVRGFPSVFDLSLPARILAPSGPETLEVAGVSRILGPGQILQRPGEFSLSHGDWSVANRTASGQVTLRNCQPMPPSPSEHFGGVVLHAGRLSEDEIQELLNWKSKQDTGHG